MRFLLLSATLPFLVSTNAHSANEISSLTPCFVAIGAAKASLPLPEGRVAFLPSPDRKGFYALRPDDNVGLYFVAFDAKAKDGASRYSYAYPSTTPSFDEKERNSWRNDFVYFDLPDAASEPVRASSGWTSWNDHRKQADRPGKTVFDWTAVGAKAALEDGHVKFVLAELERAVDEKTKMPVSTDGDTQAMLRSALEICDQCLNRKSQPGLSDKVRDLLASLPKAGSATPRKPRTPENH